MCVCAVAIVLFLVQFLASSIFPGTNKGIQMVINAVSFSAWGHRGLVLNEFDGTNGPWGCPGALKSSPIIQDQVLILGRDVSRPFWLFICLLLPPLLSLYLALLSLSLLPLLPPPSCAARVSAA